MFSDQEWAPFLKMGTSCWAQLRGNLVELACDTQVRLDDLRSLRCGALNSGSKFVTCSASHRVELAANPGNNSKLLCTRGEQEHSSHSKCRHLLTMSAATFFRKIISQQPRRL